MPSLAEELFAPGEPLDAARYFIIMPDGIGRGGSSKPSDGLRAKFPHYRYEDMVASEHQLVIARTRDQASAAGARRLDGRHADLDVGLHLSGLMDGLVPIASQPIQISGRNWMQRRIAIEAIRQDPGWHDGNYDKNPVQWTVTAPYGFLQTENILQVQAAVPSREVGDALYRKLQEEAKKRDANDTLWGIEAVMDYNPTPHLKDIKARLVAINSGDDDN